nr:mesoderm induction early response protein 1 [Ipomoea batatas]
MAGPDMGTITASLERSLQNCSLNYHRESSSNADGGASRIGAGRSSSSSSSSAAVAAHHTPPNNSSVGDATLELNSEISMPYHWEQCLDLETGEVYYINWRTGMKVKEDPRITKEYSSGEFYSEEEEEEEDDGDGDGDSCYDDDTEESGSSSEESTLSSSRDVQRRRHAGSSRPESSTAAAAAVLVVAGCKTCLMYFMVPKEVDDCPKCCGQLLHFDRSDNSSP